MGALGKLAADVLIRTEGAKESLDVIATATETSGQRMTKAFDDVNKKTEEFRLKREKLAAEGKGMWETTPAGAPAVDPLANLRKSMAESGVGAHKWATDMIATMDRVAASGMEPVSVIQLLTSKIAILKAAVSVEQDPRALKKITEEIQRLNTELLRAEKGGYAANRRANRELKYETHHMTMGLMSATMLMSLFSKGSQEASGTTKIFKESLESGVQAALGMTFGLQMLPASIARLAGPIGIAVGALIALRTALNAANEEAEKTAAEGMAAVVKRAKEMGGEWEKNIEKFMSSNAMLRQAMKEGMGIEGAKPLAEALTDEQAKQLGLRKGLKQEENEILAKLQKEFEAQEKINARVKAFNEEMLFSGNAMQKLQAEYGLVVDRIKEGKYESREARQVDIDSAAEWKKQLEDLNKTTSQHLNDEAALMKARLAVHQALAGDVVIALERYRDSLKTEVARLGVEKDIRDVQKEVTAELEKQIERWDKVLAAVIKQDEQYAEALTNLREARRKNDAQAIEGIEGIRIKAWQAHLERLASYDKEYEKSAKGRQEDTALEEARASSLREYHRGVESDITRFTEAEGRKREQSLRHQASAIREIGASLSDLFGEANSDIQKFINFLARAVELLARLNAPKMSGEDDVLGTIADVVGAVVGFAGLLKAPSPGISSVGGEESILAKIASESARSGATVSGGWRQQSAASTSAPSELIVSGVVDISNGKLFLRREMPDYEKYQRKKLV